MTYEWQSRKRQYDYEKRQSHLASEDVSLDHPLQLMMVTVQESKVKRWGSSVSSATSSGHGTPRKLSMSTASTTPIDPLSVLHPLSSALEGLDPLSQFAVASDPLSQMAAQEATTPKRSVSLDDGFEPWTSKKSAILNRYTTSEKLSITTSFLSGTDKVVVKSSSTVSDKVKTRLEQLDDFEEGSVKEMLNLSQQEYVCRIEELNQALRESWDQDQRVKALKIAIQCAILLVDTAVIQFYPSKFVLITDILDNFGRLVNQRIHAKAQYFKPGSNVAIPLPENFTPEQVPEDAKETCRNWFFKIASIRELIPRFYVEAAILRSYSFLNKGEYSRALMRLTKTIRGIGDPLVAAYARCYLCRVGMSVAPDVRDHVSQNFWDFLQSYNQLSSNFVKKVLAEQSVPFSVYLTLFSPALDWILQCVTYKASDTLLAQLLDKCQVQGNSALLLNSIMAAFQPQFVANRALKFVEIMKECEDTGFPKPMLFRTLGLCLAVADPPENQRLQVLNEVWKVVTKLKNPSDYMSCAEVWIQYPVKHFTKQEVNTFLGDILKHMLPDRAFENHYPQLASVVQRLVTHLPDVTELFSMDKFLPFLDMLQKENVKVDACKAIIEAFIRSPHESTSDPVVINALMFICKTMHDPVNALTLEDEKRQISHLISSFIRRINFGRDFEQQLTFYVEARATFSNLDPVLTQLVQSVNLLAMKTRQVVQGHHTRKTASFVKACTAYAFITIPSLMGVFQRLELYLVSGQVALLNQCLSQADAFFKAAVSLLPEVPPTIEMDGKQKSSEPYFVSFINNLLSTLLIVPDHPEQEPLYLVRGLLNIIREYSWDNTGDSKVHIYMGVLNLLAAMSQEKYIYCIEKVDSNDSLYGSDPKFLNEINNIGTTVVEEVLTHLKYLGDKNYTKRQSNLALDLFLRLVIHSDISSGSLADLAYNLWMLAHKYGVIDNRYSVRCLELLKKKGCKAGGKYYATLASRLQIPTLV